MSTSRRLAVILDHDGGVDDFAAQVILGVARHYRHTVAATTNADAPPVLDLIGVIVLDADCFVEPAAECSLRIAALCKLAECNAGADVSHVHVGMSTLQCAGPTPFPDLWRKDCVHMLNLPCLNSGPIIEALASGKHATLHKSVPGEELMAQLVMNSPYPVAICVTGPLSNVAYCLRKYGEAFAAKIDRIVIMGGAFDVHGNVFLEGLDGKQEWNLFWDPAAADFIVTTPLLRPEQKVFFGLDATNDVPVTEAFVHRFGAVTAAAYPTAPTQLANFLGNSWSTCTCFPRVLGEQNMYYAWDALTAAYVLDQRVCTGSVQRRVVVDVANHSPGCGRTEVVTDDPQDGGVVTIAKGTVAEVFYQLMLTLAEAV
jgi:purine nucleosidase